jgi:thiol:disulfide interchange protein
MLIAFAILVCGVTVIAQEPATKNKDILTSVTPTEPPYSPGADANKELHEALTRATSEHKRVMLVFGANWCYDCHVLDNALHEGEAGKLFSAKFLLVHVDIGEGEKNAELVKEYKIPLDKGVPAVAVLDADGKLLYSSGQGEFEAARRMLKHDLIVFLKRWSPIP